MADERPMSSADVLTEVRFWSQVMGESKRTVLCPPDLESRCKGYINARGLSGILTVKASPFVPDNQILVIDDQATGLATAAIRPTECTRGDRCQWILCSVHAPETRRDGGQP